jgi:hypothetical protein
MSMAKDTFFLRTNLTTSTDTYVSDNIDISAYTDPSRGKVLVVDRGWVAFASDGQGPIQPADVGSGAASKTVGVQACSEKQTSLQELDNNSVFMLVNLYAATIAGPIFSMIQETAAMNPLEMSGGFIIPTDAIHCGLDVGSAWNNEIDVGFCFEVHTEKLSLRRIQELLVSLTAN